MIKKEVPLKYLLILTLVLLIFTSCSTKVAKSEFNFANIMARHDLWKEALIRWEKLIPKMKDSSKLYNNMAIAYEKMGEFEKAEDAYKTALKLSPRSSFIQSNYKRFQKKGEVKENDKTKKKNK